MILRVPKIFLSQILLLMKQILVHVRARYISYLQIDKNKLIFAFVNIEMINTFYFCKTINKKISA